MKLVIDCGHVTLETPDAATIEEVSNLAKAAEIVGIPKNAIVTSLHFQYTGSRTRIDIGWRL